jgi:Putative prokaryotic signal transducing protein
MPGWLLSSRIGKKFRNKEACNPGVKNHSFFGLRCDPALIAVAKSILESAEITFITQNEGMPSPSFPIELQVEKQDEQEARQLLGDL